MWRGGEIIVAGLVSFGDDLFFDMSSMNFNRRKDALDELAVSQPGVSDFQDVFGCWENTDPEARGISKVVLSGTLGEICVSGFGIGDPDMIAWGSASDAMAYVAGPTGGEITGFTARFDLSFMEVELQANFAKGLLIIASFNRFKDSSGRNDYFAREFFLKLNPDTNHGSK